MKRAARSHVAQAVVSCRPPVPMIRAMAPSRATSQSRSPVNGRSPAWAPNSRRVVTVPDPGLSPNSPCRPRLGPPSDGPPPPPPAPASSESSPRRRGLRRRVGPGTGRRGAVRRGRRVGAGRRVAAGARGIAAAAGRQDRDRRVAGHGRVGRQAGRDARRQDLEGAGGVTGVLVAAGPAVLRRRRRGAAAGARRVAAAVGRGDRDRGVARHGRLGGRARRGLHRADLRGAGGVAGRLVAAAGAFAGRRLGAGRHRTAWRRRRCRARRS